MTEKQLKNRIAKLDTIIAKQKELEEQAEKIREEIKADMQNKEVSELAAGDRVIRWKEIVSNRFDSKALKNALPEIYKQFCKPATSKRFTIA